MSQAMKIDQFAQAESACCGPDCCQKEIESPLKRLNDSLFRALSGEFNLYWK